MKNYIWKRSIAVDDNVSEYVMSYAFRYKCELAEHISNKTSFKINFVI